MILKLHTQSKHKQFGEIFLGPCMLQPLLAYPLQCVATIIFFFHIVFCPTSSVPSIAWPKNCTQSYSTEKETVRSGQYICSDERSQHTIRIQNAKCVQNMCNTNNNCRQPCADTVVRIVDKYTIAYYVVILGIHTHTRTHVRARRGHVIFIIMNEVNRHGGIYLVYYMPYWYYYDCSNHTHKIFIHLAFSATLRYVN